jgi:hypothetical protein
MQAAPQATTSMAQGVCVMVGGSSLHRSPTAAAAAGASGSRGGMFPTE